MKSRAAAKPCQSRPRPGLVEKRLVGTSALLIRWTRWPRRTAIPLFATAILIVLWSRFASERAETLDSIKTYFIPEVWNWRREAVRDVFTESWDAYAEHAWGRDRFHRLSKTGSQMSPNGLGWIIVDSLDTLMLMNLTTSLADARRWVSRKLDYEQSQDVNTFETTIRILGGLLSAHYLSQELPGSSSLRDHVYLAKAADLAERLLGAYTSRSGVPFASIDLKSGTGIRSHSDIGVSSTAEATTLQIEMKCLSNLTGNEIYWRRAEKVMKVVDDQRSAAGLVPIFIDPQSGRFTTTEIRLGSRGDSYYEYLIKQYLHTSEQEPV